MSKRKQNMKKFKFNRQCVACHVVADASGEVLAGRNAKTGPNLYGVAGRALGSVEDFRYGDSIVELGEGGTVWTEETFVGYVQDPTGWLRETLDNRRARGKMAYQVRAESDAYDLRASNSSKDHCAIIDSVASTCPLSDARR